jgi:5-formyltetrahydrofolate cyclo-ligase
MEIAARKKALREELLSRRAALIGDPAARSHRIADNFLRFIPLPAAAIVSAYVAIGDEADPAPLIDGLRRRGHRVALPRVVAKGEPLAFHLYEGGTKLVLGIFGLSQPDPNWPKVDPDVLAVPLLGFDARGNRIGYGAGFYDRTLTLLRSRNKVLAVGYAFAGQEVPEVPHRKSDEVLDWIVTEEGARKVER